MNNTMMEQDNILLRVTLGSKLTITEVPDLQTALKQAISEGIQDIIFDMRQTQFLDSMGIGLLVATKNSLSLGQGNIQLVHVCESILKLLQSMRLVDHLHATTEEGQVNNG